MPSEPRPPLAPHGRPDRRDEHNSPPARVLETGPKIRGLLGRIGFWLAALLWLPVGIALTGGVQSVAGFGTAMTLEGAGWLVLLALCGLPLAVGCRRLRQLGYRRVAWIAGAAIGAVTVSAALAGGPLGPVWVAFHTLILGAAVWLIWPLLPRRR